MFSLIQHSNDLISIIIIRSSTSNQRSEISKVHFDKERVERE